MPWKSASPDGSARRSWRPLALVLVLALVGALTLVAVQVSPLPNALGILPNQETILTESGLTLQTASGTPTIPARTAVKTATKSQPESQAEVVFLATVVGSEGSRIAPPGRLCWIVLLSPGSEPGGDTPVPGQIDLDAVVIDARTGAVIEGFIAFHGTTPHSEVGIE